jgi:hypothetical protein
MELIRLVVAVYPKAWRRRYGDEFSALLEDRGLTPHVVLDVLVHAVAMHARLRTVVALSVPAVALSACVEALAVNRGVTENILWAPTSPLRALALLAVLAPWVALISLSAIRRRRDARLEEIERRD